LVATTATRYWYWYLQVEELSIDATVGSWGMLLAMQVAWLTGWEISTGGHRPANCTGQLHCMLPAGVVGVLVLVD